MSFASRNKFDAPSLTAGAGATGGMGVGGASDDAPAPAPTLQITPWWQNPPPSSQYFYVDSFEASGAYQSVAAGTSASILGSSLQINEGERAVISGISLVVDAPLATDNYYWTLLRNGGPVEGLNRLRNFSIAANGAVRPFNGYVIKLDPRDLVEWTVTNNGGAAVSVSISYFGWRASIAEIARVQQGINY